MRYIKICLFTALLFTNLVHAQNTRDRYYIDNFKTSVKESVVGDKDSKGEIIEKLLPDISVEQGIESIAKIGVLYDGNSIGTSEVTYILPDRRISSEKAKYDIDGDGFITPMDALKIVNHVNTYGFSTIDIALSFYTSAPKPRFDVNSDGYVSPTDVLSVVNELNRNGSGPVGNGENAIDPKDYKNEFKIENKNTGSAHGFLKYTLKKVGTLGAGAKEFLFNVVIEGSGSYSLTTPYLEIEVSSPSGRKSKASLSIDANATSGKYAPQKYAADVKVPFSQFKATANGGADFSQIETIEFSFHATGRITSIALLGGIAVGPKLKIQSPEDYTVLPISTPDVPSTPPLTNDPMPSPSPSESPRVSPSPIQSPTASPSAFPVCPNFGDKFDARGQCCPEIQIDSCGICNGKGPVCGVCGDGPFPFEQTPNKCGGCGFDGLNSCGDCQNFPGSKYDLGCGCSENPNAPHPVCGCTGQVPGCDGICGSSKVVGGCDNQCGSTKVPDACGVCDGDGLSCECLFVAGWADASGYVKDPNIDKYLKHNDIINRLNITTKQPLPTCLSQKISPQCRCGEGTINNTGVQDCSVNYLTPQDASVKIWGACYFSKFAHQSPDYEQQKMSELLGVPPQYADLFTIKPPTGYMPWAGDAVYWHFDKNCNFIANPGNRKICGYAGASWSPISLILDEKVGLSEDMQVVEFNLAGKEEQGFVLWKASSSAPLLVYDPKNTNKVKDAKQLFGNFAFGGKTDKVSDYSKKGYREPWKHGYEALALLDINVDGKLSGKELDVLKLWSDKDRDGVSDKGEVETLSAQNITTIFYKNPTSVQDSKDVELRIGYERTIDGKSTSGKSVDWFSETFSSKAEASSALMGIFSKGQVLDDPEKKEESGVQFKEIPKSDAKYKGISVDSRNNLSGYWVWTVLEKGADKNPGLFVLSEKVDGTFTGYSVSEAILAENGENLKSAMFAIPGEGMIARSGGKDSEIHLLFRDRKAGGAVESIAKMSEDGKVMRGTSKQRFEVKVGAETKSAEVTYDWIATKFES